MKIGILECGHARPEVETRHGSFPQMFERLLDGHGFEYVAYDVENMVFPESIKACDGWLLTGSKHGAYEDHAFIPPLENFIRDAFDNEIPMVGICFGHQIIAQALGGRVEKFNGGWALGMHAYNFEGIGPVKLNAWHQDQVVEVPSDAQSVASSLFCENAALIYGNKAFTIQAHPEFDGPIIAQYSKILKGHGTHPDDLLDKAAERVDEVDDNTLIARKIAGFFLNAKVAANV